MKIRLITGSTTLSVRQKSKQFEFVHFELMHPSTVFKDSLSRGPSDDIPLVYRKPFRQATERKIAGESF